MLDVEKEALAAGGRDPYAEAPQLAIADDVGLAARSGAVDLGLAETGVGHGNVLVGLLHSGKCNGVLLRFGLAIARKNP